VTRPRPSPAASGRVSAYGVGGLPKIAAGDDVAALVVGALRDAGESLADGDVVVVSSKVVSKAAGLVRSGHSREEVIEEQTVRVVAERVTPRGTTQIIETPCGVVLAAAGVDASNTEPGTVLTLPTEPDVDAENLRRRFAELTGVTVGVVISDTAGRPWRDGQVDFALGAAGLLPLEDFRGISDPFGNRLEVTQRAIVDEVAALADLVKGKVDGVPVAVVRGLDAFVSDTPGPGARALQRYGEADWFQFGHVEAVRAAIAVPAGSEGAEPPSVTGEPALTHLGRLLRVAWRSEDLRPPATSPAQWAMVNIGGDVDAREATGEPWPDRAGAYMVVKLHPDSTAGDAVSMGAFVQRVLSLARAEGLQVQVQQVQSDGLVDDIFLYAYPLPGT